MNYSKATQEQKVLLHICQGIIEGRINTMEDMRKIWPNLPFRIDFFNNMFEEIIDSFEHLPSKNGKDDRESFEYLNIYLASEVLKCNKNIELLAKVYKKILAIKNLTKEKIDEEMYRLNTDSLL